MEYIVVDALCTKEDEHITIDVCTNEQGEVLVFNSIREAEKYIEGCITENGLGEDIYNPNGDRK